MVQTIVIRMFWWFRCLQHVEQRLHISFSCSPLSEPKLTALLESESIVIAPLVPPLIPGMP